MTRSSQPHKLKKIKVFIKLKLRQQKKLLSKEYRMNRVKYQSFDVSEKSSSQTDQSTKAESGTPSRRTVFKSDEKTKQIQQFGRRFYFLNVGLLVNRAVFLFQFFPIFWCVTDVFDFQQFVFSHGLNDFVLATQINSVSLRIEFFARSQPGSQLGSRHVNIQSGIGNGCYSCDRKWTGWRSRRDR